MEIESKRYRVGCIKRKKRGCINVTVVAGEGVVLLQGRDADENVDTL